MSEEKKSETSKIPEYIQNFPFEPTITGVKGDQNFQKLIEHPDFKEIMKNYDILKNILLHEKAITYGRGFLQNEWR